MSHPVPAEKQGRSAGTCRRLMIGFFFRLLTLLNDFFR